MILREALKNMVPYVPGKHIPGAIKLASNENPLGPSPLALEAVQKAVLNISLYPDGACVELTEKLAEKLKLEAQEIILGNGSDEVIVLAAAAYVEAGTNTVTSEHTFSEYAFATQLYGGEIRKAPMVEGKFQLDAILKLCDSSTRIVWLCNPNNPTGTYFSQAELKRFLSRVSPLALVVVDEAYNEYADATDYTNAHTLLSQYPNLLVLRTFSKIYGLAGLRIGYGIGHPNVIEDLKRARAPFPVNNLAQTAAMAALDDIEFLVKSREVNAAGKLQFVEGFKQLGLKIHASQANFLFVEVGVDCTVIFERLMVAGITIRPLKSFGFPSAIRVTIGTKEQNAKFLVELSKAMSD